MDVLEIVKKILKIKSPSAENRRHFSNMQSSIKNDKSDTPMKKLYYVRAKDYDFIISEDTEKKTLRSSEYHQGHQAEERIEGSIKYIEFSNSYQMLQIICDKCYEDGYTQFLRRIKTDENMREIKWCDVRTTFDVLAEIDWEG